MPFVWFNSISIASASFHIYAQFELLFEYKINIDYWLEYTMGLTMSWEILGNDKFKIEYLPGVMMSLLYVQ